MPRGYLSISKKQYRTFGTESLTEYLHVFKVHVPVVHPLSFHNKIVKKNELLDPRGEKAPPRPPLKCIPDIYIYILYICNI